MNDVNSYADEKLLEFMDISATIGWNSVSADTAIKDISIAWKPCCAPR